MSFRINTNIPAMGTLRNLENSGLEMNRSINRLSTGLRINNAADDPAGLIISEGMRAQIKGLAQAVKNSQDAVNMAKTAEAALDEVQSLIRGIRGLAVHSANTATIDVAALQANQAEIRSTLQSIDRIAQQTQFGNKKLLDGTAGIVANVTSPPDVTSMYFGSAFAKASVVNGPITINRVTEGTAASLALDNTFTAATDIVTTAGSFVVNGYTFTSDGTETLQGLVAKINSASNITNVTAQIGGTPPSVTLMQNTYGSAHAIDFVDANGIFHSSVTAGAAGVDAVFDVSLTTDQGVRTVQFTGGKGPNRSGLTLSDSDGNTLVMTSSGNANISSATQVGVTSVGNVRFQIGANADQSVTFGMPVVFANRLGIGIVAGKSLADIDVTTPQGAQDAMRIIDAAVTQLAQMRGELGSFQKNFLESTVRSLGVAQENLTATESQIRDADMAQEITEHTRLQILQQSGISVLAQANQAPQNVLQLLRQ